MKPILSLLLSVSICVFAEESPYEENELHQPEESINLYEKNRKRIQRRIEKYRKECESPLCSPDELENQKEE